MFRITLTILLTILLVVSLLSAGCTAHTTPGDDKAINVVTTVFPVADIINNIGGDEVTVSYLLPPGASPHTFEPTIEQIKTISKANVFIYVGGGLDDWSVKLTEAASDNLITVELTSAVQLLQTTREQSDSNHNHEDSHYNEDCNYGPNDPHIWLDPLIVRDDALPLITEALTQAAPDKKDFFYKQKACYAYQLTNLHEEIKERISGLSQKKFITFHSAWQYYANQYGLEEAAVIARFPGQEPSACWIAELVNIADETGTKVIFCEPQLNNAIAIQLANEIGGDVVLMDPLGGQDLKGRSSYIELMRYNTMALEKSLN